MSAVPHIHLFKRHRFKIIIGALIFWLLIGLFVFTTETIARNYFKSPALDVVEQKQYLLRWFLWLFLTPIIIALGLKINIRNSRLFWFVLIHIGLGTSLLTGEFLIEVAVIKPFAENFYLRHVDVGEIILPFLFKYFAYIITYFLIIGIVNIYVYMESLQAAELQKKELEFQLALSQLQTLRMQIHPHFLFNTHHSIIALITKKENDKAAKMLSKLSDLLRTTIEKQEAEFVPLAEEINTAELYLGIQLIRFNERFTYHKNIAPETEKCLIPYFILQPIIENAVIYGIEKTENDAFITINSDVESSRLVIEVINTGLLGHEHKGFGIGIANIKSRLQQYYGNQSAFELRQNDAHTTIATIKIPCHES
ncbi:sensor histidine kinase [Flavobacterium pallidum]|uniref:Signal transduction histidine kinase internal region domain-containing protein n=1 Tax=Flavobacterium pallidum TaxID=2172098 RepID=A0A2S1SI97_9FLAO|nr:histidine kinase [Flavobacterium pallidum]AWI26138.1 hypothetical protein HYN49_09640 [Flavobacterium pallidum]